MEWALRTLDARWQPLLGQVHDERALEWDPAQPPRPGEVNAARQFVSHALDRATRKQAETR